MGVINSKLNQRIQPSSQSNGITQTGEKIGIDRTFRIVWLDAESFDVIYQNSISRLQRVFTSLHTFTDVNDCTKFLSTMKNEMIVMVVSNELFPVIWSRVKSMSQIHSIYILSSNGEKVVLSDEEYSKVNGVFNRVETICSTLKRRTQYFKQDALIMSIIPSGKFTKKDFSQLNPLFLYWMLAKQIILEHRESIRDLTRFCRTQYFGNTEELKVIEEFERTYAHHSPIWWYTRECFLRTMLNRALQTQDIEILIRMGFFIKDLDQQIGRSQTNRLPIVAYRSQNVSIEEFEKMKDIKGNLLALNNFIMADLDYQQSYELACRVRNTDNGIGILFQLKIESKSTSSVYTSLENFILFSMHSIFRIIDLKELENRLWQIDLILTEANDESILSLSELLRSETQETVGWYKLAQLMIILRDYDRARDIYFALLELVPKNEVLKMAHIYNQLGLLEDELGHYQTALQFYQKSIDIRREHLPPNHRSLGVSYNNMGEVQRQMGDYMNALSTHRKTLDIKQKILPPEHMSIATTYNNIGLANELLGEFPTALECYQKAIDIKLRALPVDHQELATTYNNIGELQRANGKYSAALANLEKAMNIRLKKYPPTDPIFAITYNNIGLIYRELGDFIQAIVYLEKSLDVKFKHFPPNHSSLALTYNNIGDIRNQMGEYTAALASYQTALEIQEKTLVPTHPEIATTYTNIGVAHQAMANYTTALTFYDKALAIRKKALPPSHPLIAVSYNNIGHAHQLMGKYQIANGFYEKTLKAQQKTLSPDHPSIAATYNNLADIQRKLENHKKALSLYQKSLEIKKKSLPPHHPAFVITYNNMGIIHQSLKNYSAALECYKQTLEIQQKTLPPSHPNLALIYNNMGTSHQLLAEYSIALEYYQKALKIQEKSLPPNHPDIAMTHNSMATVYVDLGNFEEALKHEQQAVNIASQALPVDHTHLLTFQNYLERIRIKIESMKNT